MQPHIFTLAGILAFMQPVIAQTVHGHIQDKKGRPVAGVSVIVAGTFKGSFTDSAGEFTISTVPVQDTVTLKVSSLGFDAAEKKIGALKLNEPVVIILFEKSTRLQDVVISAGNFEASDEKKTTILKPFDLATTPAASPDVFKAIEQLPGTTKVGESEGLFVRGGAASETKAVIDGMIVQDPFFSSVPGVAQKGRFSPLLFKGTAFSTGGYSAQYGEALSSVLLLNTQDVAQASSTSIILSTAGISGNVTKAWNNTSLAVNSSYYNLRPSFFINKQNFNYDKAPRGGTGNIIFRSKGKNNGLFKLYASYEMNDVALQIPYLSIDGRHAGYSLDGKNLYINSTYKKSFNSWQLNAGVSFSMNNDHMLYDTIHTINENSRTQERIVLTKSFSNKTKLFVGSELQYMHYDNNNSSQHYMPDDVLFGDFIEMEFFISNKIAVRAGLRNEVSGTLHKANLAPRVSIAYVLNKYSQFSAGYGNFYQLPAETYLFTNTNLLFEKASHYIFNYQFTKNRQTFRVEVYYKDYDHLVKEAGNTMFQPFAYNRIPSANTNNTGYGYAKGIDIFWYDKRFKTLDYWVSYSWLDTKRLNEDYPVEAMPPFAAHHNVSVVVKYSIPKTSVNIGFAYNYTSGRPYYNPNSKFLSDKMPPVNNLVFSGNYSWFHKTNLFALFAYVDNILGIRNVYRYVYSSDGAQRYSITPPAYRSIYAGINITLAKRRTIMGINF